MNSYSTLLLSRLRSSRPLVLDSAMGTQLEDLGVAGAAPVWSAAALVDAPETVAATHRADVLAGAEALTADTFRTHARSLAARGLAARAVELTRLAVSLAREAAGISERPVLVLGSLSPLEDCYRPDLAPDDAALGSEHARQAAALAGAGVDGILLETHNSVRELTAAARAAKATELPVVASMVTDGSGRLLSGEPLAAAARAMLAEGVDAIGINCVPAPLLLSDLRELAAAAPGMPLSAFANFGRPLPGAAFSDGLSPDAYAEAAASWVAAGVRLVGGCCGTGPAHTAALRKRFSPGVT